MFGTRWVPAGNRTMDSEICAIASQEKRIVVSKDGDFVQSFFLNGVPPQLLLIATGNIANPALLALFRKNLEAIQRAFSDACFVELHHRGLIVHE